MSNNVKRRFNSVSVRGAFIRIDKNSNFYAGLDIEGRYALKFRGRFTPEKNIKSADGILLNQFKNPDFCTLQFTLSDQKNSELFFIFCTDILKATFSLEDEQKIYRTAISRFYSWKKMFSSQNRRLSENEIMGLMGELLFLKQYLFNLYGQSVALRCWSGQELTHKDFSLKDIWYEVKSIHTGRDKIKISSLEQLQSSNPGQIIVVVLEKMSESYNGITISALAKEIFDSLNDLNDRDIFLDKISLQGFSFDENYDDIVFDIKSISRYKVDKTFPALLRGNINEAIVQASYELSLPMIKPYLIEE